MHDASCTVHVDAYACSATPTAAGISMTKWAQTQSLGRRHLAYGQGWLLMAPAAGNGAAGCADHLLRGAGCTATLMVLWQLPRLPLNAAFPFQVRSSACCSQPHTCCTSQLGTGHGGGCCVVSLQRMLVPTMSSVQRRVKLPRLSGSGPRRPTEMRSSKATHGRRLFRSRGRMVALQRVPR